MKSTSNCTNGLYLESNGFFLTLVRQPNAKKEMPCPQNIVSPPEVVAVNGTYFFALSALSIDSSSISNTSGLLGGMSRPAPLSP